MKNLVKLFAGAALAVALFVPTIVYGFTAKDLLETNRHLEASRDPYATAAQRAESERKAWKGLVDMMQYLEDNPIKVVPFHGDLSIREISDAIAEDLLVRMADESILGIWKFEHAWGVVSTYTIDVLGNLHPQQNWISGDPSSGDIMAWTDGFVRDKVEMLFLRFDENTLDVAIAFASDQAEIRTEIILETDNMLLVEDECGGTTVFSLEDNSLYLIALDENGRMVAAKRYMPLHVIAYGEEKVSASAPAPATPASATTKTNNNISVTIEGKPVNFEGQPPVSVSGRTLVPVRGVFEMLGFEVEWNNATNTAIITNADYEIRITVGSDIFTTNGVERTLDVPAQNIGGRTMVPLRLPLESVGYSLEWDGGSSTVLISAER